MTKTVNCEIENASAKFVHKLYCMSKQDFPKEVLEKSRECFLDYLSVAYGGCGLYKDINTRFIKGNKMTGECHIIGCQYTTDIHSAVMINAFNAHVLELDDSHRIAMTHLGAPIFSALLGVAELHGCTLNKLLKSAIVGYEAAIRLANAIQPSHKKRGFHVSGTCCTVGGAMGIAAMLGYSFEEMENVFSAAVTSAAGLLAVISGKSEQKPYNIANAAVAGVNAALYGKYFKSAVDILGDSRGFFNAVSDEYDVKKLFEDGYAMTTIYQKLYAACRHCHAPMEAMLNLKQKYDFKPEDIKSVEVLVYELAIKGHNHTDIAGCSSAKQSIPYGVSVACIYQNCGIDAFAIEKIESEEVSRLTQKVIVHEDPELTKICPDKRAAIVKVQLKNDSEYTYRVDYAKGEPENPITKREFKNKFYELTACIGFSVETIDEIFEFVTSGLEEPVKMLFQFK